MKLPKYEPTEHQIQSSIIEYLQYKGFFVWRNNSGMVSVGEGARKRMIRMGVAGLPDVFAVKGGKLYGIEVKRPKNKTTELQTMQLEELRKHGAIAFVAHSVEEVESAIKELSL